MATIKGRTLRILMTLLVIIILNFIIPRAMPGDPLMALLGEDASANPEILEELRKETGLDKPLLTQFIRYCRDLAQLNFGYSYHFRKSVTSVILERLPWTLGLLLPSIVLGALLGVGMGAFSALKSRRTRFQPLYHVSVFLYSVPAFLLAMMALNIFSIQLSLFPLKGFYQTGSTGDILHHYLMPVTVLTIIAFSRNFLIMRGSVLQEMDHPYVSYARAKGLSLRQVLIRHIVKNALPPVIPLIALDFGFLFSGALFIEIVFSLNGLGTLIFDSILSRDYPLIQGIFMTIALMVILANLMGNGLQRLLDPRTRKQT